MLLIPLLILIPFIAALLVASTQRFGVRTLTSLSVMLLLGCTVGALTLIPDALSFPSVFHSAYAAPLGPDIYLRADALSVIYSFFICGIGACIVLYAGSYLREDKDFPRLLITLLIFTGSMQIIAFADDIWLLFIGWELTSVTSYLLVTHARNVAALRAATTALLVTGLGGLALLAGLLLLQDITGTSQLSKIAATGIAVHDSPLYVPALILIILGCATKSALFPFHFWLPAAMAAPTPVSAYLHAATMVKAGIFLLAKLHPALGGSSWWEGLLGTMAALTIVVAIIRLPGASDLKAMLAWSTVLALGTLAVLLSLDSQDAALAAVILFIAHAGYKSTLFLTVGSIDHGTGTRDISKLSGLRKKMPWSMVAGLLGAGSMMGLPPFAGFVAKEQIKLAGTGINWVPNAALFGAAIALVSVACWVGIRPFWGRASEITKTAHESSFTMLIPMVLLGSVGLLFGLGGSWLILPLAERAAADITGQAITHGAEILPHVSGKSLIAVLILAVGILIAWQRSLVAQLFSVFPKDISARAWDKLLYGIIKLGHACVHVIQHGDLRGYLAVVILSCCAFALPNLSALPWVISSSAIPLWVWSLSLMIIVGAFMCMLAKTRLVAVAGLGAVGYAIALMFLGFGAPDLALTQFFVETLMVVLFVLAFRHLPDLRTSLRAPSRTVLNCTVSILAGLLAMGLVLAATSKQLSPHLGNEYITAAWERGLGANAVNVILVDIRALDTLGEITVLLISAIGVAALIPPPKSPAVSISRSPILIVSSKLILLLATLLAIYFWWRGHHNPGGGFVAGLCLGGGVILVAATQGGVAGRKAIPVSPMLLAASGLGIALIACCWGMLTGNGFLHASWYGLLGTPLLFDLGVAFLVTGITIMSIERLLEAEEAKV